MAPAAPLNQSLRAPGRLPAPLTSFVGRDVELETVAGLMARHRLVTVTGPGGSGKTRLAIEVGRRNGGRFADGVALVDLSGVIRGDLVAGAIAAAVGIRQGARQSMLESLAVGLQTRQMLVVVDNCEHVADAVAEVCERLLVDCDDLWILATSTVDLRVQGEARFRVPALGVPALGEPLSGVGASEAVILFVDRASASDPDFTLSAGSQEVVAEIVRRLDGVPLAVELAAARMSSLGINELLAGLDHRLALLVRNSRGAPERQQSLRASLDWSYQLLSEVDQATYRRLAVFAAPFTLAAASVVCGPQAVEVIPLLVDCSLLAPPVEGVDGRSRYRMLETMRAHADELLTGEERVAAGKALVRWAVGQAGALPSPFEFTEADFATMTWVDAEQDNLRQAIQWAAVGSATARLRLAIVMGPWCDLRGRCGEGVLALEAALAGPEQTLELSSAAEFWLGELGTSSGHFDDSVAHFAAAADHAQAGGQFAWLVDSLAARALVLMDAGRIDEAASDADRAMAMARDVGEHVSTAYLAQAAVASDRGDHETGLFLAKQAQRGTGASWWPSKVQARCYLALERFSEAEQVAVAELAVARKRTNRRAEAWFLGVLAEAYVGSARISDAAACASDALHLAWRLGTLISVPRTLMTAVRIGAAMDRPQDAAVLLAASNAVERSLGPATNLVSDEMPEVVKDIHDALTPEQQQAAQDRGTTMGTAAAIELACSLAHPEPEPGATADGSKTEPKLSQRERELLALVAQGSTDAQIAEQLFISIRTVRSHLDRIRDKSGYRRRADLTRLALQAKLV